MYNESFSPILDNKFGVFCLYVVNKRNIETAINVVLI